ncbi:MAG TPA: nuclear transport factor 2 family protein [Pyrinomonadaceae bacterium]|jgi:ketosteroid isomerase-like protein
MKRFPVGVAALLFVLFTVAFAWAAQEPNEPPALSALVEAERAFARTSVEKGVRDAFIAFFADEGINFTPHPSKTKEEFLKTPATPTPPPITLNWEPIFADVSRAGDLGYTTGPFSLTDNSPQKRPTRHGYYFSIWRIQADGTWKVVLDAGIQTPAPPAAPPQSFRAARRVNPKRTNKLLDPELDRAELITLEREFASAAQKRGMLSAFLVYASNDARLHRNGMLPLTERNSIRSYLSGKNISATWQPLKADVSRSADLGYTYGSYEAKDANAQPSAVERGYYVHVWKRQTDGRWKVVLDTLHPLPPERSK